MVRSKDSISPSPPFHTPKRTYYLEDGSGDEATAELWVQTICSLQARPSPPVDAPTENAGVEDGERS